MKKLILSLFLFCSVFAFSQGTIPIPQIIGLPAALASKVDKVTGKSLVADTSIVKLTGVQAGAQVNKIDGIQKNGVDLTITGKKVNITVPTTATEIGAQPAGAYATGTGTAYNSNNGDETLTSIKTKLGAATAVSDGYLKYQDYVKFDGKLSSEVDGSVTNELQTISTNGNAGNITLSNSGGTLNLNVNDADASATNEIQDLSLSGNTLTLSSDATTVNISQATAVLANTAKVSNANHTGDATGSTALTLATVNSNIGTFNNVTINAKGLATAGSNVSYEPAFSKNSAFNKNFGTTSGTVLEGRTFGTAANSAVGDFIQNQNASPQSANMWINGSIFSNILNVGSTANTNSTYRGTFILSNEAINGPNTIGGIELISSLSNNGYGAKIYTDNSVDQIGIATRFNSGIWTEALKISLSSGAATFASTVNATQLQSTVSTGTAPLTVNSTTMVGNLNAQYWNGHSYPQGIGSGLNVDKLAVGLYGFGDIVWANKTDVNAFIHGGLTTNYLPKWNGSSFVNSVIYDDGTGAKIESTNPFLKFSNGATAYGILGSDAAIFGGSAADVGLFVYGNNKLDLSTNSVKRLSISGTGIVSISSTTPSTSPTNGALVVNGGVGADHVRANNFYGNGSNLTGVQLPITLTTNGTSGAATFENGVMNVPNYTSSGGVNQTQTTVNGSTSGTMVCSMPFQTGSYKKVIIYVNSLNGSATYTFPSSFSMIPRGSSSLSITALSATSITIAGISDTGWCIIEGY